MGISQIAGRLRLSRAFVTIEANKLVAEGLVEKVVPPTDGRRVLIVASEEGRRRLTGLAAFQRPINDALFEGLSREEIGALSGTPSRLAANGDYALKLADHVETTLKRESGAGQVAKAGKGGERRAPGRTRSRRTV
jgi:hypothetical protein